METNEYEVQAQEFLKNTGSKLELVYIGHDINENWGDDEYRDHYEFTLSKGDKEYTGEFWQSIANAGTEPTAYDILSCLGIDYTESFEDFCSEFGYNDLPLSEYPRVKRIYDAVQEESEGLQRLYTEEELEQLAEIN